MLVIGPSSSNSHNRRVLHENDSTRFRPGRFISLDSQVQPRWRTPCFTSALAPHAGALSPFPLFAGRSDCLPPLNNDDLINDEPTETGTSEKSNTSTPSSIANAAGSKGPEPPRT